MRHPMQPTVTDSHGVLRFLENPIVSKLLEHGQKTGLGLNELARQGFAREHWVQFNQIIGYSVSGCPDMTPDEQEAVDQMVVNGDSELAARLTVAESHVEQLRETLRPVVADLFGIHPDDLSQSNSGRI